MPECEHENRYRTDEWHEEGYLVEYSIKCKDCGQRIAHYAYGTWDDDEECE